MKQFAVVTFAFAAIANFSAWPFALTPQERAQWVPLASALMFAALVVSVALLVAAWERIRKHAISEQTTVKVREIQAAHDRADRAMTLRIAELMSDYQQPKHRAVAAPDDDRTWVRVDDSLSVDASKTRMATYAAAIIKHRARNPKATSDDIRKSLRSQGVTITDVEFSDVYREFESALRVNATLSKQQGGGS